MSENHFFNKIPGPVIREGLKSNNRLVVFVIFIGIATLIWFLWTLEKDYTTIISSPIEFVGIPNNTILVNELPKKIQLEVKGGGFNLLRYNWDLSKPRLKIDFKSLYNGSINSEKEQTVHVYLDKIRSKVDIQLPNIEIKSFLPDTISLKFAGMVRRMIPVAANLDLELEKQYMIRSNIKITPDSIEVSGPSTILDTLKAVYTSPLKIKKVKSSLQRNLELINDNDKLRYSEKRVQVDIPVEQFTEKSLEVPIHGINIPDSMNLKLFPASSKLTFRVVVSEFEAIQAENFQLSVDYNNITDGSPAKLSVSVLQSPEYISNIKINPANVSYIIEYK